MGGRILRPQLNESASTSSERDVKTFTVGTQRVVGVIVIPSSQARSVSRRNGPSDRQTFREYAAPVYREFDGLSKSVTGHKLGRGLAQSTKEREPETATKPFLVNHRSRYICFERHDEGWMETHRWHDGGKISVS